MGIRVLGVEAGPYLEQLLRPLVEARSYELVMAPSLAAAQAVMTDAEPIHVALIDETLPDGPGIGLLAGLQRAHSNAECILLAAQPPAAETIVAALRAGAFDCLEKSPGVLPRMVTAIERIQLRLAQQQKPADAGANASRLALAMSAADEAVWDWHIGSNRLAVSALWWHQLGEAAQDSSTIEAWLARAHPDDAVSLRRALEAAAAGENARVDCEYRVRHRDGGFRWLRTRAHVLRDASGVAYRVVGSQCDETLRKQTEEQLRRDALYDPLTGLANQVLFRERLGHALQKSRRRPVRACAVLFMDLDRFKNVNDSLGHTIGDRLLVAIAQRLAGCLRSEDTFARLGGDEFAILLEGVDSVSLATEVADRLRAELKRPFLLDGHEVFAPASIGITMSGPDQLDTTALIRDADTAMYRAKARGSGSCVIFDHSMHAKVACLLQLETDIRHAIDRREFRLFYQPIVALGSGRLSGFEALLRWSSPTRGWVPPEEFVPAAEDMGVIGAIGRWVLRKACAQLSAWRSQMPAARGLYVAANVSSKQFSRDLVTDIRAILDECNLPADKLHLEVTESSFIDDLPGAKALLGQLKDMGIKLSLDDFGTGYSSLSSLHKLPFDTLKIDRSFIRDLKRGKDREIVNAILTLARSLGMTTVAEGIESAEQASELRRLRCGYGQGFHYAKPFDARTVGRMLHKRSRGKSIGPAALAELAVSDGEPTEPIPPEVSYPIDVR